MKNHSITPYICYFLSCTFPIHRYQVVLQYWRCRFGSAQCPQRSCHSWQYCICSHVTWRILSDLGYSFVFPGHQIQRWVIYALLLARHRLYVLKNHLFFLWNCHTWTLTTLNWCDRDEASLHWSMSCNRVKEGQWLLRRVPDSWWLFKRCSLCYFQIFHQKFVGCSVAVPNMWGKALQVI